MSLFRILLLFTLLLSTSNGFAQNGFLGRKSILSIDGLANIPLLSGSFNQTHYRKRGDEMKATRDFVDFGASLRYVYGIGKRFGMGTEITLKQTEVLTTDFYRSSYGIFDEDYFTHASAIRMEPAKVNSWFFGMMYCFNQKKHFFGSGIAHKLSAGYTLSYLSNSQYDYSINEFYIQDSTSTSWTPVDQYTLNLPKYYFHGITLSYGLHINIPLKEWFQLRLGSDVYATLYTGHRKVIEDDKNEIFRLENLFKKLQREQAFTWNVSLGFAFVL